MFRRLINKPHHIFWSLGIVFIIMGTIGVNLFVNIPLNSDGLIIEYWIVAFVSTSILTFFGLWYWLCIRFKLKLNFTLNFIHVIGTCLSLLVILYLLFNFSIHNEPQSYYSWFSITDLFIGNIIILLFSQIAIIINGILILIRRIRMLMNH